MKKAETTSLFSDDIKESEVNFNKNITLSSSTISKINTVDIITIQSEKFLNDVLSNGVRYSDAKEYVRLKKPNLFKPYEYLVKAYGYNHYPIFACAVGYNFCFSGISAKNSIAIQLRVPINEIRVQKYYDWTDLIYYMERVDEWKECNKDYLFEKYCYDVMFSTNLDNIGDSECQITLERIRKEWIITYKPFKMIESSCMYYPSDILESYQILKSLC